MDFLALFSGLSLPKALQTLLPIPLPLSLHFLPLCFGPSCFLSLGCPFHVCTFKSTLHNACSKITHLQKPLGNQTHLKAPKLWSCLLFPHGTWSFSPKVEFCVCILAPWTDLLYTSVGRSWDSRILVDPEPQQRCPYSALFFLYPPIAKPLSLLTLPYPLYPFCILQPDWHFKIQVGSCPCIEPSDAISLLLQYKANSVSCYRQDSACCPMPFLGHFPSSSPLPQPYFLPGFFNELGLFPLPGMFFPQPSACWFLLIFLFLWMAFHDHDLNMSILWCLTAIGSLWSQCGFVFVSLFFK